jgi:UDP-N-acetylglucosamine:LPS N-acetylglucosamine transferase
MSSWADADNLAAFEQALGEPRFQGASIGSMLGDIYAISLLNGHGQWDGFSALKETCRSVYHFLFGLRDTDPPKDLPTGKYLVTIINTRPHLMGMMLPVIRALGPCECVVLGGDSVSREIPGGSFWLQIGMTPQIDLGHWRREYLRVGPHLLGKMLQFRKQHRLPYGAVPELIDATVVQSQRLLRYSELLELLRPAAVITEFDRNYVMAPLILAARSRGIPTTTLVHGVANRFYTPLLADRICCWGESARDTFLRYGVEPERITVTGNPAATRDLPVLTPVRKAAILGCHADRAVVYMASPISFAQKNRLATIFGAATATLESTAVLIRLHPSETVSEYSEIVASSPHVRFIRSVDCTLEETLAAVDVVVSHNSTAGAQSVLNRKPTVIVDAVPGEWSILSDLVGAGKCPCASDCNELRTILNRLLYDRIAQADAVNRSEFYASNCCAAYGSDAAERIAGVVRATAHSINHIAYTLQKLS